MVALSGLLDFFPEFVQDHLRPGQWALLLFDLERVVLVVDGVELEPLRFLEGCRAVDEGQRARGSRPD